MKEVYIILSPEGGISVGWSSGKGTAYSDIKKAEEALASTNKWSAGKGYGKYTLVTLEVKE